jgi:hypothetical protein
VVNLSEYAKAEAGSLAYTFFYTIFHQCSNAAALAGKIKAKADPDIFSAKYIQPEQYRSIRPEEQLVFHAR